ncbi:alpha/beta fold hydrolase [Modicisalibacter tunisiensis]|uniref:alpha/beta fold hydrolase n=1 Tax=Modicisalibacter tunisiensis TaxID=390637 RepID=UPI0007924AF3|nr:alpha/beta fold hydrolase [Modicisalibacter tunisiensis]KXS37457.1 MAG: pimelyl-[acyl-carrier protein] methyl ester esterase [Halomonadaceae bacterium T82-2]MBZ9537661.1 alpha/beta fold hydrolase [Modicisalibacter tunisiensis]
MKLVLLSGWGIDARIWRPLGPHWPDAVEVSTPDWPGYRASPGLEQPDDLEALAEAMRDALPADAVWVGWSLGALLAAALLDHLPPPRGLIRLGMAGRFTGAPGCRVSAAELRAFRRAFLRDPDVVWQRFLARQLGGEAHPDSAHQALARLIGTRPPADTAALDAGLAQLATLATDGPLARSGCPSITLIGEHDPLFDIAALSEADVLPGTGHCPQLATPEHLAHTLVATARVLPSMEDSA